MPISIDPQAIRQAISEEKPIAYEVNSLDKEATEAFTHTAKLVLTELKREIMTEPVSYFVREFVFNAHKGNLKRIHFQLQGLDIKNESDYERGMADFSDVFREKLDVYNKELARYGLYIKVIFQFRDNVLLINVRNNSLPTEQELARIDRSVEASRSTRDLGEAYMKVADNSEGAGLGTISTMLMLRNLGLDESAYYYEINDYLKEMSVNVAIPLNTVTVDQREQISERIAAEITSIPTFPENVSRLQAMINDGQAGFQEIGRVVQADPALTAELLKLVNSPVYRLAQQVGNITKALSLIGIKGLKSILYTYGVRESFGAKKHRAQLDKLWAHAFRSALYAYFLARNLSLREQMDDAYTGGVLHDIGKIIIMDLHPGMIEGIGQFCTQIGVSAKLLETLTVGVSHARIGAEIARKWNFPEAVIHMIEFHHQPLLAPDESKPVVGVVYLANLMTKVSNNEIGFSAPDPGVLKLLNIKDEHAFLAMEKKVRQLYDAQMKK